MKSKFLKLTITTIILATSTFIVGCGSNANEKKISDKNIVNEETTSNIKDDEAEEAKPESAKYANSEIHFINTGNSDAILIKGEKNVLIDGGDNDDENMLVDYLQKNKIKNIDYMISTHNHADHLGGLDSVIEKINISTLLVSNGDGDSKTYQDFINAASRKKLAPSVPLDGVKFDLGNDSYMKIYNTNGGTDTNEESLIVEYINGKDKFLFTGDAESATETEVLPSLSNIDVLKVGHHGSKSSTSEAFLNKVNPEYAVITVGNDNKYNHPHKVVMDRLKDKNIEVHRTDECETIVFTSTGNGVKTECKIGSYLYRDNEEIKDKKPIEQDKEDIGSDKGKEEKPKVEKPDVQIESVWLSATGKTYHKINNCGKMNPDTARAVSVSEAQKSYKACSKCF